MKRERRRQVVGSAGMALVLMLALIACGGGGMMPDQLTFDPPSREIITPDVPTTPGTDDDVVDAAALRNTLTLSYPALANLAAGDEFDAVITGLFVDDLYQASLRLRFDPAVLEPVAVVTGGLLLDDMVHTTSTDQRDNVPFAFTALPGHASITAGDGEIVRVRFRLRSAPTTGQPLSLINNAEYLQLRDRQAKRLSFDLETTAGVQQ